MGQAWPGGGKDGPQDRELGRRDWVETRSTAWLTTWVGKEKESWSGWFGKKKKIEDEKILEFDFDRF
jgi:hypothetical protein